MKRASCPLPDKVDWRTAAPVGVLPEPMTIKRSLPRARRHTRSHGAALALAMHLETSENAHAIRGDRCNFAISREHELWTQSLLTVRGPLQQDVAVQEAPMPISVSGAGVPGSIGRGVADEDGAVHRAADANVMKQQLEGNQNV